MSIRLTESENTLRELLLDVAQYVGSLDGLKVPQLRFTGGWVRDKLLGSGSQDIDIGIDNMTGFRFGSLMKQYLEQESIRSKYPQGALGQLAKIEANPEKSKHLETVTTKVLGLEIDLVNLRKETYTETSRNPIMEFGSPQEDALRRDATVNALFYNLSSDMVEDLTGRGLQDLELKVIKTPLSPLQTFKDDPLRVLRAIRFASRLGFRLDDGDKAAMRDGSIKDALRVKISRERIGIELLKMLKGASPHMALSLIDEIGLYGTIFTEDIRHEYTAETVKQWHKAYDTLLDITGADCAEQAGPSSPLRKIKSLLIRNANELSLAWLIACFVPWARVMPEPPAPGKKKPPSPASVAAKEGIKADNKMCKIVDDAAQSLYDFITLTDSGIENGVPVSSHLKQKTTPTGRDTLGLALRKWGGHWRCCVLFALLTQVSEASSQDEIQKILERYAIWFTELETLDLLDADKLTPIIDGKQLFKAFPGNKGGPWMMKALDIAMAWQLRNPDATEPQEAIEEITRRKRELGIS